MRFIFFCIVSFMCLMRIKYVKNNGGDYVLVENYIMGYFLMMKMMIEKINYVEKVLNICFGLKIYFVNFFLMMKIK